MAFSIQTNVNSLIAQENLRVNSSFQSQTIQRLTSGYRINQAGDDAAGLAVANKFRSDIAELTQGVRNANDGVSQLQIIDGGMNNISKMLDRLKTLATQSSSDSFTGDRNTLNSEYQTLVGEIDRQSQSIGLNQGGAFAKNLGIYLGGGAGASSSAILANGQVSVNLSKATVDSQSLGLTGVRAVVQDTTTVTNDYDLGASSATSVQKILAANPATGGTTAFTFTGPGFGDSNGATINVNLSGVGDTATLVTAINSAIDSAANLPTGAAASFKAAGIKASVVTDSLGRTQLAFDSPNAAFQVRADDVTANALIGKLAVAGAPAGKAIGTTLTTVDNATAGAFAGADTTITVNVGGKSAAFSAPVGLTLANFITNFSADAGMKALGISVSGNPAGGAPLAFSSATGQSFTISTTAGDTNLTLGATLGAGVTNSASLASNYSSLIAGGVSEIGTKGVGTANTETDLTWVNLGAADKQAITISGNDASGGAHPITINLEGSGGNSTGASVDAAIGAINKALQQQNDSTLHQITAVKVAAAGGDTINFVSTLSSFSVSAGLSSTAINGLKTGAVGATPLGGFTNQAIQVGTASAADISTAAGAQTAVAAITAAVKALGTAQAAIGKGQNQLGYAISLANSQIANFSAAQSQIRDADVASEAANLSKAQVLQQASIAAMAQANSAPQAVLALLRG
ncbi:MAG TPA: flagellin [Candidatus Acidoferrales bacterium]|jgi:flagellin|nr:flagellin [Candidatus Acidoferrales bacterium]